MVNLGFYRGFLKLKAPVHGAGLRLKKRSENLERLWFRFAGSSEEEILDELEGMPLEELEDRSLRELEVLARNDLAEEWGMDFSDQVDKPAKISTVGRNPHADPDGWRISFPDEPSTALPRTVGEFVHEFFQNERHESIHDRRRTEDVYHEVGHLLNGITTEESEEYETLEEYMYEEAIAKAAVLEAVDEPSSYYQEKSDSLEALIESSPIEHVDEVLEKQEDYREVLKWAETELSDISNQENRFELGRWLSDFNTELQQKKKEADLSAIRADELSVYKNVTNDVFLFENVIQDAKVKVNESGVEIEVPELPYTSKVFKNVEQDPADLKTFLFDVFSDSIMSVDKYRDHFLADNREYVEAPETVQAELEDYINRSIQAIDNLNQDNLERYRQALINDRMENRELIGHTLGYALGDLIHESDEFEVSHFVKLPEDEAISELRPLMEEVKDQYDITVPLDAEVDYRTNILDREYKTIMDFVNT